METKKKKNKIDKNIFPISIKIQFLSEVLSEIYESYLFKIYIKSFLLNKNLKISENYDVQIFQQKYLFNIKEANFTDNSLNEFSISEETIIVFENLENSFSNLNINNGNSQIFEKNKMKVNENIEIVGLDNEIKKLTSIVDYNLLNDVNNISKNNKDLKFIKGIFIQGPSGTGKTILVKFLSKRFEKTVSFFEIKLQDFTNSKDKDDKLRNIFKLAKLSKPSILFIDDIDKFFPKSSEEDDLNKILSSFLIEYDNITHSDKLMILATTNSIESIDNTLRRGGRFDITINLSMFSRNERRELLNKYLKEVNNNLSENDIEILSDKTHGFVASDIISLFKDSLMKSFLNAKDKSNITLIRQDLETSLLDIKPISLKDIILEIPKVYWKDIGGNKESIKRIRQSVEWPLKNKDKFEKFGIKPIKGILLYGPPGCSKTLIAKALATESGLNFLAVRGPELFSKYVGDSEKSIRDLFRKAKLSSPSIIFFDEIDSMANQRGSESNVSDRVLCQLLNEMDGIESRESVIIFAATNRPDILDKALIRSERFDRLIYIPPPDLESRIEILKIFTSKMPCKEVDIQLLANKTEYFSGAELTKLCKEAALLALEENIECEFVTNSHFLKVLQDIKPTANREMLNYYENFSKNNKFE